MKTVRLKANVVAEIIPEYALPVEKWYGAEFANQCVEAPDEVEQRWTYNAETGVFSEPTPEPETPPDPVITAPRNIVSGEYVTINGTLYMATQNIPNGEPIIVGQNAIQTTIETVLYELNELRGE